jgi:TolA-binding protein
VLRPALYAGLGIVTIGVGVWLLLPASPSTDEGGAAEDVTTSVAAAQPPVEVAPPATTGGDVQPLPAAPAPARPPRGVGSPVAGPAEPATPPRPARVDPLVEQISVARAKLQAKLYDQAVSDLRAGLAASASSAAAPSAYLLLGAAFEEQRRIEDAMGAYIELRSRYGRSAEAMEGTFRLAELMLQSRREDREQAARALLSEIPAAQAKSPWAPRALMRRAVLEDRARARVLDATLGIEVPASLVTYRHLVETYPADEGMEVALNQLAEKYDDVRRYDLAAETWLTLARRFPANPRDAAWRAGELFERRVRDAQRAREAYALVPPASSRFRDAQRKLQP